MAKFFKAALLLFMAIMISMPAHSAKKAKNGYFLFEGAVDKKTKAPNGEGTLYFRKSYYNPSQGWKKFEKIKVTTGTFNGWKGHGTISHPFWEYTGEIAVDGTSLILTNGDFEVFIFDDNGDKNHFRNNGYYEDTEVTTLWGNFPVSRNGRNKAKYTLKFHNTRSIHFPTNITKPRESFIEDDSENTYLEDVNIAPFLEADKTGNTHDLKVDILKLTNNMVNENILKLMLQGFDDGVIKVGLNTEECQRHNKYSSMPLYFPCIDTRNSNMAYFNATDKEIELRNKKGMGFWCRKTEKGGYYLIEKFGQIGDEDIERMYCSADNCWYVNRPYSDGTQISGAFVTPDNEIKFGIPAGDGLANDNTVTSWYKKNGKIYQDEKPRVNIYKLNDAKATSQFQTVIAILTATTLPDITVAKRQGNTLVANADTKQLLGTILVNGKYKAEPTARRQTAKRKTTRSSNVNAAQTMISLYKGYKDGKKRYKEEQRRKAIRKMLNKR